MFNLKKSITLFFKSDIKYRVCHIGNFYFVKRKFFYLFWITTRFKNNYDYKPSIRRAPAYTTIQNALDDISIEILNNSDNHAKKDDVYVKVFYKTSSKTVVYIYDFSTFKWKIHKIK